MEKLTMNFSGNEESNELIKISQKHPVAFQAICHNLLRKGEAMLDEYIGEEIGEGNAAVVFFFGRNKRYCVKIMKPEIANGAVKIPGQREFELQNEAHNLLDDESFVPKPKAHISRDEGNSQRDLIIMERVMGPSIQNILDGDAKLPEKFDFSIFFEKLYKHIETLHRNGIHHRDLHEGNVMIDEKTGNPIIIDFGTAYKTFGDDDDPYVLSANDQRVRQVRSDISSFKLLRKQMTTYCQI